MAHFRDKVTEAMVSVRYTHLGRPVFAVCADNYGGLSRPGALVESLTLTFEMTEDGMREFLRTCSDALDEYVKATGHNKVGSVLAIKPGTVNEKTLDTSAEV